MVFSVKNVQTPADKNQFIRLPWEIYGDYSSWVPPLISEREKFLNPAYNPFFKEAEEVVLLVVPAVKTHGGKLP